MIRLTLLFLLMTTLLYGQPPKGIPPNYKQIEKEITERKSDSYYPVLMERYMQRDTTLTNEDMRNLYYGYTFQKTYEPYKRNPDDQKLAALLEKDNLNASDQNEFIEMANRSLKDNPFDLRAMNMLAYFHHQRGNEAQARTIGTILNKVISAIISSGDGITCETAFHVISTSHEYELLSVFELQSQGQSLIGSCDYLRFEKGKYKIDGLYFNVSKLFESMGIKK